MSKQLKVVLFQEQEKYTGYFFIGDKLQNKKITLSNKKNVVLNEQDIKDRFPNLKECIIEIHNL